MSRRLACACWNTTVSETKAECDSTHLTVVLPAALSFQFTVQFTHAHTDRQTHEADVGTYRTPPSVPR